MNNKLHSYMEIERTDISFISYLEMKIRILVTSIVCYINTWGDSIRNLVYKN